MKELLYLCAGTAVIMSFSLFGLLLGIVVSGFTFVIIAAVWGMLYPTY